MIQDFIDISDAYSISIFYHKNVNLYMYFHKTNGDYNWITFRGNNLHNIDLNYILKYEIDIIIEVSSNSDDLYYIFNKDGVNIIDIKNIGCFHYDFICDNITDRNVNLFILMNEI